MRLRAHVRQHLAQIAMSRTITRRSFGVASDAIFAVTPYALSGVEQKARATSWPAPIPMIRMNLSNLRIIALAARIISIGSGLQSGGQCLEPDTARCPHCRALGAGPCSFDDISDPERNPNRYRRCSLLANLRWVASERCGAFLENRVAGRDRTSGYTPCSANPDASGHCRAPTRPTTFELLGLTQHRIGSRSLGQISDCRPTSVPLVEAYLVVDGSVDSDQKLVGLAGLALCHEDLRRLVSHFEHLLTYR